jgi:hypothetical protein
MKTFTSQKSVSSVTRLTGYVGNISQSTTITTITSCYLRPLSETESSNNGYQYGVAFNAIFEVGTDIRQQDKITIEGVEYLVKGTISHDRGFGTQYVKALMVKPEN